MAGIEKICEFSGEYPGHDMYGMKLNQLQIDRKYRKRFRKAEHVLKIFVEEERFVYPFGGSSVYEPDYHDSLPKGRVVKEYKYELHVTDPELQGEVNGIYLNWSMDISTVKRKLKRLLRCRKLNIEKHY